MPMASDAWTETWSAWFGAELRFGTSEGSIRVREESGGPRGSRARCVVSGAQYDLRRLIAQPTASSGHVALEALESVQQEAELSERAGKHPNIVRCHGILVQNVGPSHCQLLLCEPCGIDLLQHVAAKGGDMAAGELADLGQQLAMGLAHLHGLILLYGSLAATGVLRGSLDGLWKLGDFSRAAALPVAASEWRGRSGAKPCEVPPEARGRTDDALKPEADVWLLASLLFGTLCGSAPGPGIRLWGAESRNILEFPNLNGQPLSEMPLVSVGGGDAFALAPERWSQPVICVEFDCSGLERASMWIFVVQVSLMRLWHFDSARLLDASVARLWLLLRWLLAEAA
ncbi:rskn-2 [Symbiodinium pilosum]|uniref:Rskn-2 protein n=1 Tax=Symbiodinium pilosum TaxID=2952 RepID=A0A812XUW9_SYMPI|nr:rskn-2 [Symbiodinium pilosum]